MELEVLSIDAVYLDEASGLKCRYKVVFELAVSSVCKHQVYMKVCTSGSCDLSLAVAQKRSFIA